MSIAAVVAPAYLSFVDSILLLVSAVAPDVDVAALRDQTLAARSDVLAHLKEEGLALGDTALGLEQTRAVGVAVAQFLRKHIAARAAVDTMKVQQLMARMCEYAETVFQTCFGPRPNGDDPIEDESTIHPKMDIFTDEAREFINAVSVKLEEIRPSSEPCIAPNDQQFHELQNELRGLMEDGEALRSRIDTLAAQNEESQNALDAIESHMCHRLERARARYIRFTVRLEEEWLTDPKTREQHKLPCAACTKSRATKPKIPHPSPVPGTTVTLAATAAT